MPRATMSVATSTRTFPDLKSPRASVRCPWLRLPWILALGIPPRVSTSAKRLARCLVRVKQITLPITFARSNARKRSAFKVSFTGQSACSIPAAGLETRSTFSRAGLRSICLESSTIGGGSVALKNSVCRSVGICRSTCLMAGRKPISSIRSASSRISTSNLLKST